MQKMTSNLWDGDKMHYWPVMYYQGFALLIQRYKTERHLLLFG